MREALEFGLIVVIGVLVFVIVVSGVVALLHVTLDRPACNELAAINSSQQIEWKFWTGCLIYIPDESMWLRYDDYMNFLSVRGEIDS